ncbi:hypothetical protein BY996DRAFT_6567923 [Phakopsora pachyrhizi]|nr:hypothetical protein BY996DRAFT_6567923 [Phakopsora pachyrhizi]
MRKLRVVGLMWRLVLSKGALRKNLLGRPRSLEELCFQHWDRGCIKTIAATGGGAFKTHSLVGPQNYFADFCWDGSKLVNVTIWPLITITGLELRGVVGLNKAELKAMKEVDRYLKREELTLNTIGQENKEFPERFELKDFGSQINVDWSNGWGIYLLMEDPNKPVRTEKMRQSANSQEESMDIGSVIGLEHNCKCL